MAMNSTLYKAPFDPSLRRRCRRTHDYRPRPQGDTKTEEVVSQIPRIYFTATKFLFWFKEVIWGLRDI